MRNPSIDGLAEALVVLGAINWGLVGVANVNLVESVFSTSPALTQFVYILVGLSGLYWLWKEVSGTGKKK